MARSAWLARRLATHRITLSDEQVNRGIEEQRSRETDRQKDRRVLLSNATHRARNASIHPPIQRAQSERKKSKKKRRRRRTAAHPRLQRRRGEEKGGQSTTSQPSPRHTQTFTSQTSSCRSHDTLGTSVGWQPLRSPSISRTCIRFTHITHDTQHTTHDTTRPDEKNDNTMLTFHYEPTHPATNQPGHPHQPQRPPPHHHIHDPQPPC